MRLLEIGGEFVRNEVGFGAGCGAGDPVTNAMKAEQALTQPPNLALYVV